MIRILMKHNLTFPILICFYLVLMGFAWTHSANADEGRKSTIQEPEKETDESAHFRQICIQHRPSLWTGSSSLGGNDESTKCQAVDGGNVGISITVYTQNADKAAMQSGTKLDKEVAIPNKERSKSNAQVIQRQAGAQSNDVQIEKATRAKAPERDRGMELGR